MALKIGDMSLNILLSCQCALSASFIYSLCEISRRLIQLLTHNFSCHRRIIMEAIHRLDG